MTRPTHDPLTDPQIKSLAPGSTPIDVRDRELRGLILTILPSGRKQFALRYRAKGKQRRLMLGEYPGLSLAKARKLARTKQSAIDAGADPAAERQEARRAPTDTIEALATEYLAKHARVHKRTAAEDERMLNVYVLPRWRERSVRELTRRDVRTLVEGVAQSAPIQANRVLALVRKMLNYGIRADWLDANPAALVEKPGAEQERDRVLTDDGIGGLWRCLSHFPTTEERPAPGRKRATGDKNDPLCPLSPALAATLKVRLLTAARGGEVVRMRWRDVDLTGGWWTIPPEHSKNGRAHRLPLPPDAVAIIQAQISDDRERGEYVFVGRGGAQILDRAKKAPAAIATVLGFDFRGHDLRRTAATKMAQVGIPQAHIAYVLNHVDGLPRATRVYQRYQFDAEKRTALESWARALRGILSDEATTGSIVPFAREAL
jgi:integrase